LSFYFVVVYNYIMTKLDNTSKKPERDKNGRLLPGQPSLNPAGKPAGVKHLSTLLWEALQERARMSDGTLSEKTNADLVIQRLLSDNIKYGKRTELIFDRIEGQAKQEIDFTTGGDKLESSVDVMEMARQISAQLKAKKTK